ncbi:S1C family serine protease [Arsukibacterium sp.]|uniref:S1C family serine protease n=1 Tax=Arsukibacterium sp. TaxID=1977258 RepID=UPI002FD9459A
MLYKIFTGPGLLLSVLLSVLLTLPVAADTAQNVFSHYQDALIQVQVIEKQTQRKSSIGSGFYVSEDLLITNYHVIANRVLSEQQYQLMASVNGQSQQTNAMVELDIVALDVVNDLALLRTSQLSSQPFRLAAALPLQGEQVFSLGNPHDLGMVVVPGTYNGYKQQSFYPRLHVTGSINPGMSGGPSVNALGEVIGVNVATGGNQLGFVVPMAEVASLLQQVPEQLPAISELKTQMLAQLLHNQQQMLSPLLSADWQMQALGKGRVPENIAPFIQCWGRANPPQQNEGLNTATAFCGQREEIFLSSQLNTGKIQMQFEWVDGSSLPALKFNQHYMAKIGYANADNRAGQRDVTEFSCHSDIVGLNQQATRVIFCVRAYKAYPGLFDALYLAATVAREQQGFISHFTLAGVSADNANAFARKFMEAVVWQY